MSITARARRRVLLAAGPERLLDLLTVFADDRLEDWDALAADSFAHARFLLQHHPCDLLLVGSDMFAAERAQGLNWLVFQCDAPLLLLADDQPGPYARAFEMGFHIALPMGLALSYPALLNTAMQKAVQAWQTKRVLERTKSQLNDSHSHVDRLVQMIWRMTPQHEDQWYPQRHILERLGEELARCERHQVPLSVAVGELAPSDDETEAGLPDWSAEAIVRGKRRSDVVGQYGPNGFLLLMVHTPKPGGVTCCKRLQEFLEHSAAELPAPHRPIRSFFGVASASAESLSVQALLRSAEQNLQLARNQVEARIVAN